MLFTRRRWDAWCIGSALFLAAGGAVNALLLGGPPWSPLAFATPVLLLAAWRFDIPRKGVHRTPIRQLPLEVRQHIWWCVGSLPLLLVAAALAPRHLERWWLYPLAAAPHVAITLWLARRADLARLRATPPP